MNAGGTLELTEDALRFVPHRFNFGIGGPAAIPLSEIESVSPIRPLVLGVPSLWSNAILVKGREGRFAYVILVFRRSEWIEAIEAARGHHESVD
ncbi:MAG: hypothetical protein ACXWM8_05625 [Candidatus Limnocylindrales bacterium]